MFLLILTVFFYTCSDDATIENNGRIKVTATTGMIADAVLNIGGDKVEVTALMGPGVDPHLYKATQSDLKDLRDADVIFYNGLKLEGKMQDIFEKLATTKEVYCISDDIDRKDLLSSSTYANTFDPHIWFDVQLWTNAVVKISEALQQVDPENKLYYESQQKSYLAQLTELHSEVRKEIEEIPEEKRILITTHDAFHYFSKAYGIRVEALQGISTSSEIGLKDIKRIVDLVTETNVEAVFVESSVSSKSLNAVVEGCAQNGHTVMIGGTLFADAMGDPASPEGTYIGMVRHNLQTIKRELGQTSEDDSKRQ